MSLRDFLCRRRVHTCARCCDDKPACVLAALVRMTEGRRRRTRWQEGTRDHD
jgi:hypothetical protein